MEATMTGKRAILFGTNFKMHQTAAESAAFFRDLAADDAPAGCQRFVIPPYTSLAAVTGAARELDAGIWVGAQNMHWAAEGAFTGEISAPMLTALGVELVLLGHAERRGLFHETDGDLNKKVMAAIGAGLRVLLCVGETADERRFGVGEETVARQLKIAVDSVPAEAAPLLNIAYEPVWSIGDGGTPAHPADVAPISRVIRQTLGQRFGKAGNGVPILYGGSVNPGNAAGFVNVSDIDGLFVGRAAWTVDGFRATLQAALAGRGGD